MTELLELYITSLILLVTLGGEKKQTMKVDMIVSFDNGLYLKDGRSL